jgi:hypothetical protein
MIAATFVGAPSPSTRQLCISFELRNLDIDVAVARVERMAVVDSDENLTYSAKLFADRATGSPA